MRGFYRSQDPRWITLKYPGKCLREECQQTLLKGQRAWYYPLTRSVMCECCGKSAELRFAAEFADERGF